MILHEQNFVCWPPIGLQNIKHKNEMNRNTTMTIARQRTRPKLDELMNVYWSKLLLASRAQQVNLAGRSHRRNRNSAKIPVACDDIPMQIRRSMNLGMYSCTVRKTYLECRVNPETEQ